jgi:hypothetical protein
MNNAGNVARQEVRDLEKIVEELLKVVSNLEKRVLILERGSKNHDER